MPVATRVECVTVILVDGDYRADRVLVAAFPAAMRYAGPRERSGMRSAEVIDGCSHFIVGRDHGASGRTIGSYDAQLHFDDFEPHELDIEPDVFENTFGATPAGRWRW